MAPGGDRTQHLPVDQVKLDWTPPEGMDSQVAAEWRRFYSSALREYGTTPADYRAMYLAQLGRCYICQKARGKHPDDLIGRGGRRLAIDHNHALGNRREAVRGLLCSGGDKTCNRIIGWLPYAALRRACDYVLESPGQAVLKAVEEGLSDEQIQGMVLNP